MTNNVKLNPFHIQGMIRDENLFFNQRGVLKSIWGYLRKGSNVSIVARRRMGKSSLLWHIKEKALEELKNTQKPKAETFYITMELISTEKEFFDLLAEILKAKNATTREIELKLEKRRVILCLDEFDRTANNDAFSEDFFAILRGLSQDENLTLVVATKIPLIEYSDDGMTSPFYNIFQPLQITLGPFTKDDACELLTGIADLSNKNFGPGEISKLLKIVKEYYPWNLQLIGWCWFDTEFDLEKAGENYLKSLEVRKKFNREPLQVEREATTPSPEISPKKDIDWIPNTAAILTFLFVLITFYTIIAHDTVMVWIDIGMAAVIGALYARQFFKTRRKKQ